MSEDTEPSQNISGGPGSGGRVTAFETGAAETTAEAVIDRLGELYWQKTYGGQDAVESLVRTVLSQNTSDTASQPAHDALMERYGNGRGQRDLVDSLADADQATLADTIAGAGLHNQKSARLVDIATGIRDAYGSQSAFDEFVRDAPATSVRATLRSMPGVGPKTADCVLLFAGGRDGVFPVDTHVHRIYRRLGIAPPDADHEAVRHVLEEAVPAEKCGFGHTTSIQFGREYCTARDPACLDDSTACPLADLCDAVGIDSDSSTVVDPAETVSN